MRLSRLFSHTTRDNPGGAQVVSHQLLVRAGYIQQLAAGIFTFSKLGLDKFAYTGLSAIDGLIAL
ncbi:MAG: hypothetical protein P1S60_08830, partial [Anaerolineae bacterium]|nr:hypothetical protein [Anaerolineae bacterium]